MNILNIASHYLDVSLSIYFKIKLWVKGYYDEDHDIDKDLIKENLNITIINSLQGILANGRQKYRVIKCYKDNRIPSYRILHSISFEYKHYYLLIVRSLDEYNGLEYTPAEYCLEFGSEVLDEKTARVSISQMIYPERKLYYVRANDPQHQRELTIEMLERFKQISGMQNYDLLLRNCEHVANYVLYGLWHSQQVNEEFLQRNWIVQLWGRKWRLRKERFINTFPAKIRLNQLDFTDHPGDFYSEEILGQELGNQIPLTLKSIRYRMILCDPPADDMKKILVIGSRGTGKSTIINVLCNKSICRVSKLSMRVTRDIWFVTCKRNGTNDVDQRDLLIIDTMGLYDKLDDIELLKSFLKDRLSTNQITKFDLILAVKSIIDDQGEYAEIGGLLNMMRSCLGVDPSNLSNVIWVLTHIDKLKVPGGSTLEAEIRTRKYQNIQVVQDLQGFENQIVEAPDHRSGRFITVGFPDKVENQMIATVRRSANDIYNLGI